MSRNVNSRFAANPTNIDISRSRFERTSSVTTTFNAGDIVPFYLDEVLPGDTFDITTSKVVRMQTLITPIFDSVFLDTYYFFVPARLCWEHWENLNGENTESAWIPQTEYSVPQITSPSGGWNVGTIADYFGLPTGVDNLSVNALPFRAYALIMNDWFRDQNLSDPLDIPVDDSTAAGSNGSNYITDVALGGMPFKASKYHDYFTSALPSPQKGPDVAIGISSESYLPVVTQAATHAITKLGKDGLQPVHFSLADVSANSRFNLIHAAEVGASNGRPLSVAHNSTSDNADLYAVPDNLYAYNASGGAASMTSINQLRMAFAIQKAYEKDARGGTRYIEMIKAHFGVTSPDARLQRPEYLGGNRIPIRVSQVIQQSATDSVTPQGNTAGYSLTTDKHGDFTRSFTEHGFVIGVMVARYPHSYQQGIERLWSRKTRFDYYLPVFANIGEQAILNKEIYAQGNAQDDEVFGYQEAWADYRYKPSRVTGEMRSSAPLSLDSWHLADDYAALPTLSDSWIREDSSNINRVIAVSDHVSHQFLADICIQNYTTRPMPLYSIPGLIDHH